MTTLITTEQDFLARINKLFGPDAKPSNLFEDVSKRLTEQIRTGELAQLTAHEGYSLSGEDSNWPPLFGLGWGVVN